MVLLTDSRFRKCRPDIVETPFLYLSGVGSLLGTDENVLYQLLARYGECDIYMIEGKRYCFAVFRSVEEATKAKAAFSDVEIPELDNRTIMIMYAEEMQTSLPPPEPECTSATDDIVIPGLTIIENFVSVDEEQAILVGTCNVDSNNWEKNLNRRVQHFGFTFNYRTLMLDFLRDTAPIPAEFNSIVRRMENLPVSDEMTLQLPAQPSHKGFFVSSPCGSSSGKDADIIGSSPSSLSQLTINEYYPGQGIAQHIDTDINFGQTIFILSLGSGITMTFQKRKESPISDDLGITANGGGAHSSDRNAHFESKSVVLPSIIGDAKDADNTYANGNDCSGSSTTSTQKLESEGGGGCGIGDSQIKHVWLPQRSLIIMKGDCRNCWSHGIASRLRDKVNGVIIPRGRRISLTFRRAIKPGPIPAECLKSSHVEVDHVYRVYDSIAVHWNHTRGRRKVHWHKVKAFLECLSPGSLVADIGSGDGKYFGVNPNITIIGCDRSWNLLQVSKEASHETFCCDAVALPLTENSFDATICIAVLHHLASVDRRVAALRELVRITKWGGRVLVQAWAQEQGDDSRHKNDFVSSQDVMVPWRLQSRFFVSSESSTTVSCAVDSDNDNRASVQTGAVCDQNAQAVSLSKEGVTEIISRRRKPRKHKMKKKKRLALEKYLAIKAADLDMDGSSNHGNIDSTTAQLDAVIETVVVEDVDSPGEEMSSVHQINCRVSPEVGDLARDRIFQSVFGITRPLDSDDDDERGAGVIAKITSESRVNEQSGTLGSLSNDSTQTGCGHHEADHGTVDTASTAPPMTENSAPLSLVSGSPEGACEHAKREGDQVVFQRYCHVYKRGELESLCSSVPHCRIVESGWDKGNWFVELIKTEDPRLQAVEQGARPTPIPLLVPRRSSALT